MTESFENVRDGSQQLGNSRQPTRKTHRLLMLEQWHNGGVAEGAAKGLGAPAVGAYWPRAREARN
jgi:hypothetical protein